MPGIYISIFGSAQTQKRLAPVLAAASRDLPSISPQELHITLAHDKETELLPQELSTEADPLREFKVLALCAELWTTKNGNLIIVASALSPELQSRWQFWHAWGLHWDFPTYRPHFSLTAPMVGVPRSTIAKWCKIFNETIQGLEYSFTNEYVQDVKEGVWNDPKAGTQEDTEQPMIEQAFAAGGGIKRPNRQKGKIPLKKVAAHRPKLSEEEEEAMRIHGFNAAGVEHRIHDLRSPEWKREQEEVDRSMTQLEKLALDPPKVAKSKKGR